MRNKLNNALLIMCFALISVSFLIQPVFATGERRSVRVACTSDAVCDDGLWCNGPEKCLPDDRLANEIGCAPGIWTRPDMTHLPPRIHARCDEGEDRWVYDGTDADGDGHDAIDVGGDDCDDNDANTFPGNSETCDDHGHNEDCDPTTVGRKDSDGDGYTDMKCYNTGPDGRRIYSASHH